MLRRASQFDLLIDKDDDLSTFVLTIAMRPDVTAKRYSRRTRGSPSVTLECATRQIDENS
jgi:hypothetical protein